MLVKELIERLKEFNLEMEVDFVCSIETGRSLSICEDGEGFIEYDGERDCVVIEVSGEETDYN